MMVISHMAVKIVLETTVLVLHMESVAIAINRLSAVTRKEHVTTTNTDTTGEANFS